MDAFLWFPAPFGLDETTVFKISLYVLLVISLTFHEYGHAWSAKKLGDDTAEMMGRLSLNPIVHLDPIFTVALPLMFLFAPGGSGSLGFCAAKPVPVDPRNLHKPTRDMMITSAAGPAMNVILAFVFTGFYWFHTEFRGVDPMMTSSLLLHVGITLNLQLAIFNMLPIPPLDGHRVLGYFLPANLRDAYYRIGAVGGMLLILALLYSGWLWKIQIHILVPLGELWGRMMPGGAPLW